MSTVQIVRIGELDVAYRSDGPADAPVILLAHGVMTSHRVWDDLAPSLTKDWRVVRYDLRGHGGTTASRPPYTMELLAADAVALLDALSIGRAHFIGTSLGGMIGQVLGVNHAERLLSLTLANTTAVQGTPKAWEERIAVAAYKGLSPLIEPTLHRWFTPECHERNPALIDMMRGEAQRTSLHGFIGCAIAIQQLAHQHLLGSIRVPTLIVAGERDTATPVVESEVLQRGIRGSRLELLPAAHQCAAECPELFLAVWQKNIAEQGVIKVNQT